MKTAVITGASSGLGKAYLKQLLKHKDIESYWIIARRESLLNELKQNDNRIKVIALDLEKEESIDTLKKLYEDNNPDIRYLINCAGMGKTGLVKDQKLKDTRTMVNLNCRALAEITEISLPYMHKGSCILEISSIASFQPMPGFAAYGASKAFVSSYAKALHHELLTSGIHVTAVCPYWIKDTGFIPNAKRDDNTSYRHILLASHADSVAKISLRDAKLNLWVSTPGIVTSIDRFGSWVIPHCIMVPIMDLVRKL